MPIFIAKKDVRMKISLYIYTCISLAGYITIIVGDVAEQETVVSTPTKPASNSNKGTLDYRTNHILNVFNTAIICILSVYYLYIICILSVYYLYISIYVGC